MRLVNSFVGARGVGPKTERRLWRAGVLTWEDFEERDVLGPKTRRSVLEFVREGRRRLEAGDPWYFAERLPESARWRMTRDFEDSIAYFDIETTGLSSDSLVTTVSFYRDGETSTYIRGDDLSFDSLQAELDQADLVVSYNGKRFDQPFLEREFGVDFTAPHLDLLYLCRRTGYTGGLKSVESQLGVGRGGVDVTGKDAVRLWREYEAGDGDALERLVTYNALDARNLSRVLDRLREELVPEVLSERV
ncbi:MAG: ribonuclease H-like domain-containing protein [Halobacteriales archaeon]